MVDAPDFRLFLQKELVRRIESNPRYSLRAFAKALAVESSFLSRILSGKRRVTEKTIQRFSARLGLSPEQTESFIARLKEEKGSSGAQRELTAKALEYKRLASDQYEVISQWYHYAILELIRVQGFQGDVDWISRALNISQPEAKIALERLFRLGLLKEDEKSGNWVNASGSHTTLGTELSELALTNLQRQIVTQATLVMDAGVPWSERDQTSMTFAFDPKLIPEARERIKRFRRSLVKFLEDSAPATEVYQLTVSLFPVSRARRRS